MELFSVLWIACVIGTIVMVGQKNLSGWYVFLTFVTGPLGMIITLLSSPQSKKVDASLIAELKDNIITLKLNMSDLQARVAQLEKGVSKESVPKPLSEKKSVDTVKSDDTIKAVDINNKEDLKKNLPELHEHIQASSTDHPKVVPVKIQKESVQAAHTSSKSFTSSKEPSNAEINFGQFWLNKIGIVIFTLGIGFFISYSFKYFSPLLKDLFGYATAGILFFLGRRFEKQDKMNHYGLALMGAGWALTYFTTYALYHFEASRIIENQMFDMVLLFLVAVGMMIHSLKAKSETMMMVSLGTAYITSIIGTVTTFTFLSSMILGVVGVFLLYRFQWIKTLFLSIGMTYGIHQFFIAPSLGLGWDILNRSMVPEPSLHVFFLLAYWVLFFVGTHIIQGQSTRDRNSVSAGNFINFSLFFLLSSALFEQYYPQYRVLTLVLMGCIYLVSGIFAYAAKRKALYMSDIVIAIFALTLAIYLKYLSYTSLMIWLIETPFMLYAGLRFKDHVLKYLSYGLSGICLLRFLAVFNWDGGFSSQALSMIEITALIGSVSMAACYWLTRDEKSNKVDEINFTNIFCGISVFYLTACLWSMFKGPWLSLCLFIEIPLILLLANYLKENVLKYSGQVLAWACLYSLFAQSQYFHNPVYFEFLGASLTNMEWTYLLGSISMGMSFWINRRGMEQSKDKGNVNFSDQAYSGAALVLFTIWIGSVLNDHWSTLGFTLEFIALYAVYVVFALKRFRIYCYLILTLSLFKFVCIDNYAGLGLAKWLMISLELVSTFAFYLFIKQEEDEDSSGGINEIESNGIFSAFIVVFLVSVFKYAVWGWRSLCLGVGAVGLIVFGLSLKDKTSRVGGFVLLALSLGRIVFVDLARLPTFFKIISFIIIGALFLGLSFMYNKYFNKDK